MFPECDFIPLFWTHSFIAEWLVLDVGVQIRAAKPQVNFIQRSKEPSELVCFSFIEHIISLILFLPNQKWWTEQEVTK